MESLKRRKGGPSPPGAFLPNAPGAVKPPAQQEISKRALLENQKMLRDQKLLLTKLRKENQALRDELQQESAQTQAGTGLAASQLLMVSRLSEEAEMYVSKIELERRKAAELEKRCRDFDKRILEGRSASDSLNRFLKDAQQINKTLENRLHSGKTKFGELLIENKNLRQSINELRFERSHFLSTLSKVESELERVNSEIERVVGESKALFEERQQVMQKIAEMKSVSDDEQKSYMAQCRELNAVLQAFELSEKGLHTNKTLGDNSDHVGQMTSEQEDELQRKIVRGKWQLAKEKALGDVLRDQAVTFEDALTRIQEATGYAHMDDFVSHFIQIEEHNFHRFQYLNSLNVDIDRGQEELAQLRMEALSLGEQETTTDKSVEEKREEAENKIGKLEQQAQELDEKTRDLDKVVSKMVDATTRISRRLGCRLDQSTMLPHEKNDEVTEPNLLRWQAALESRVSELLALLAAQQARVATADDFDRPHVALGPKRAGRTVIVSAEAAGTLHVTDTKAIIRPPSIKDDDLTKDDDVDSDLPMGEDIIRSKISDLSSNLFQHNLSWVEPRGRSAGMAAAKVVEKKGSQTSANSTIGGASMGFGSRR